MAAAAALPLWLTTSILKKHATKAGERMALATAISEPGSIRRILKHLGFPEGPPRAAPARPPPDPSFEFDQA